MEAVVGSEEGKEERAVPGITDLGNVCKHIARYNLSLLYADKKRVLDAACGSGYGSFLVSTVATSVVAVDIASPAIEYAKKHYASPKIDHRLGDAASIQCDVELVVSFETIEHIQNISEFEEMIYRCLTPGGKIIYSLPLNEQPGFNPYHRHVFTFDTARKIFPRFAVREELIQHGINFYSPKQLPLTQPWLAYIGVAEKLG